MGQGTVYGGKMIRVVISDQPAKSVWSALRKKKSVCAWEALLVFQGHLHMTPSTFLFVLTKEENRKENTNKKRWICEIYIMNCKIKKITM